MTDHIPPKPFPTHHLIAFEVPADFSEVVLAGAMKSGRLYADELLHLAMLGAECSRGVHAKKSDHARKHI